MPTTLRYNKLILTMIDCLICFTIAVPLPDQSLESVLHAVIGHNITVYGTSHSVLTDQETNFNLELL